MTPTATPSPSPGSNVIDALRRFQERRLPVGAQAYLRGLGQGHVSEVDGRQRTVAIPVVTSKIAEEITYDDWIPGPGEMVVEVRYVNTEQHTVDVGELVSEERCYAEPQLLRLPARPGIESQSKKESEEHGAQ